MGVAECRRGEGSLAMIKGRLFFAAAVFSGLLVAGCGPSGVTLLKPSSLVNYQYVTCFPHQDDPGALDQCIRYYEDRGFVKEDQVNLLQM